MAKEITGEMRDSLIHPNNYSPKKRLRDPASFPSTIVPAGVAGMTSFYCHSLLE